MSNKKYMVVAACNFALETTSEYFESLEPMSEKDAETMAEACNKNLSGPQHPRYYKVVEESYKLYEFEP